MYIKNQINKYRKKNYMISEINQIQIRIRFDKRIHFILIFRLDPAQHEFVLN